MILLAGMPGEPPLALVAEALELIGAPYTMVDQRRHRDIELRLVPATHGGEIDGRIALPGAEIDLANVRGIYTRLHGEESFPDLARMSADDPNRIRHHRFVETFTAFVDLCPGVVFNRSLGMSTNNSKGYQAQLIEKAGFRIPRTLITNDDARARDFIRRLWEEGGEVIYKSASAVRSIVRTVTRPDLYRIAKIRICPVQFQERIQGSDYRVHTVGRELFVTRIETTGTDYRYAEREAGGHSQLYAAELPPEIAQRCIRLSQNIGIAFAGIDLRKTPEGDWVCLEVNPSPAFSYYESHTGQPISHAVARALAGM